MQDDFYPPPESAFQAKKWIADLEAQLAAKGLTHREPPDEPTSCCGRGCNGCVWEGYYAAVGYWCEQAHGLLKTA
jgi:hypothetical protein